MVKGMSKKTREMLSKTKLLYQHPTTKEKAERWLGITQAGDIAHRQA
jgi:hypothetical protein